MATLEENINQAIADFDDIEAAIEELGIDVPTGTDTSAYGALIRSSKKTVDQTYNPESENAQSGIAVAEALADLPIKYVESLDKENALDLFSLESGTYILKGSFRPYPNATRYLTFSKMQLVSVSKGSLSTCVQVFYPPYNAIQYLNIWADETLETGYDYERKDAKLYYMEDNRNKVTALDETVTDEQYPSAKSVWDSLELKRIENLDKDNPLYFRDIESGYYIFHGYFRPYPNSASFITMDTMYVSVARLDEGSHLMSISPLNFRIRCYEILVDDTAEDGFTYNSWQISLLDLYENSKALVTTIDETSDDEHYPSAKATYTLFNNYCEQVNALLETIVNGEETTSE